jgi:hypothetical protein
MALAVLAGCGAEPEMDADAGARGADDEVMLGPVDGHDLPGVDLDRVQVGQQAPDFTVASLAGPTWTLSSFRGAKNVILVFYRGHW